MFLLLCAFEAEVRELLKVVVVLVVFLGVSLDQWASKSILKEVLQAIGD